MQYTEIFFQLKRLKISPAKFVIFDHNIDCGYLLEPPRSEAVLTSTHDLCFGPKTRKIDIYYLYYIKGGFQGLFIKLNYKVAALIPEPHHKKTGLQGFRSGLTQTSLYCHRRRLGA